MRNKILIAFLTAGVLASCSSVTDTLSNTGKKAVSPYNYVAYTVNSIDLGNGSVRFEVVLPDSEQYVELFVRQNGIQNVAQNISSSYRFNYNGTSTYYYTVSGYHTGDKVEYRFYSFRPGSPGVFTPGPVENAWTSLTVKAPAVNAPVFKDASVVFTSYASGYTPDQNYGLDASVVAGYYHVTANGLFGYSLSDVQGTSVTEATLVLENTYSSTGPGSVILSLVNDSASWQETTVTWNNQPASTEIGSVDTPESGELRIDVTAVVAAAVAAGKPEISFVISPESGNFFVDSKENISGYSSYLSIRY